MNKELYVTVTPHETKVALLEDDSLAEVYFERENEYTLAGSIYKGRVTRVLPGMQSAFVDIGLERDAFLYVSDFLDLGEEDDEDGEFSDVKVTGQTLAQANGFVTQETEAEEEDAIESEEEDEGGEAQSSESAPQSTLEAGRRWRGRRRRRGRRGGRDRFVPQAPAEESTAPAETEAAEPEAEVVEEEAVIEEEAPEAEPVEEHPSIEVDYSQFVLPGESIARYNRGAAGTEEEEPAAEASTSTPREQRDFHGGRDRDRGRRGRGRFDRDRGGRGDRSERPPREAYEPLPDNYTPIVLPGESISKYRGQERITVPVETETEQVLEHSETLSALPTPQEEVEPEEASASVRGPELSARLVAPAPEPVPEKPTTEEGPEPNAVPGGPTGGGTWPPPSRPVETALAAEPVIERVSEPEPASETTLHESPSPSAAEEVAQEPVAAETERAAEPVVEPEPMIEPANEPAPTGVSEVAAEEKEVVATEESENEPTHVAGSYVIEGGHVEHEELDAEEVEEPSYRERIRSYHEDEENGNGENGELLGETVRETDEERELDESEYEFNGDEFEESELVAEPEEDGEEAEEEAAAAPQPAPQRERYERRERRGRPMQRGRMRRQAPRHIPLISDLLKEGQEVLIQIAKEPIGKKGARITSHIALPGRFLVYMPTVNHIGVSRKISSEEERQRLKRIVGSERENGHGGFIVRTAAANIKEDELRADIRFLKHLWHEIRTRAEKSKAPSLIYHDLNLVERVLRDQVTSDFSQIWVDNEQEYERVVRFASRFQPSLVRRIKLYTKDVPLYEEFGISDEINKSLKSKVWLKSGGSIVINQTEALVAIDINTGKYVGKTARLEDTIVKINCDAVKEIVRQIRLRDLGGIIVIDFIDMDERKNRQKVMQTLEEALKSDRAPSKVLQFNDFGLVAITRKRVKQSLERTLGAACPYCEATGFVKSVTTVCNEIYVEMRKVRRHIDADVVTLRVHPDVAKELKGNNGRWLTEMEELVQHPVLIKPDPLLHQEKFDINF